LTYKAHGFEKFVNNTCNVFNVIAAIMLFILMIQGTADVIGRYLLKTPIIGTMERGQVLLGLMVFLSWGHTQIKKGHVSVELFVSRFSPRMQSITNFSTTFLTFLFFVLIIWRSTIEAVETHEAGRVIYVIHWPLAPFQLVVPIGGIFLCLVLILEMIQYVSQISRRK